MVISIKYDQPKHFAKMKVQFIRSVVKCRGEICAFRTMLTRLIYVCVVFPIAEIMSCKCADERFAIHSALIAEITPSPSRTGLEEASAIMMMKLP